jgi:hypothetical protein
VEPQHRIEEQARQRELHHPLALSLEPAHIAIHVDRDLVGGDRFLSTDHEHVGQR